jgi:transposase
MAYSIELTDEQWNLVAHLFDPPGRRGAPAQTERRQMVEAMFFMARTGCQWRYLPTRYGPWGAVWQQWRRWRDNGVWARAMLLLATHIRVKHERDAMPSVVIIDAQTVRGGRAGPTFHEAGGRAGRTNGTKRSILVERLGLPIAARVDSARPHDVAAGRTLLHEALPGLPRVELVLADRGYRALGKAAQHHNARLEIRSRPPGTVGFKPLPMVWRVENAFAQLGRWRRLSRCYEATAESAKAWLEVACVGYMLGRV